MRVYRESPARLMVATHALTVPPMHKTLKASIYLEYLFIFYMTRHKNYNFLNSSKEKI